MEIEFYQYLPLAERIWQLKANLTPYDAWYVALAEYLEEPLATLDGNLIRSPGPHCEFLTYPQ
jgi:predicted nucleic acid-binding protein